MLQPMPSKMPSVLNVTLFTYIVPFWAPSSLNNTSSRRVLNYSFKLFNLPITLPPPRPPNQRTQPQRTPKVERNSPRHRIEILRAKHSPDKQMCPQHGTSHHHASRRNTHPQSRQSHVPLPHLTALPPLLPFLLASRHPFEMLPLLLHPIAAVDFVHRDVAPRTPQGGE
jgi:hypothetical protein